MNMKPSFLHRLSGTPASNNTFDSFDDDFQQNEPARKDVRTIHHQISLNDEPSASEGQLPVDVHQTASDIVIRAFVAGVRPDELNISIGRDMVEIGGSRMEREQVAASDYFTRELFWGSFSRTILLPQEIDVEAASANAKDGLLTIILPRLDKAKQTKLRVKAG